MSTRNINQRQINQQPQLKKKGSQQTLSHVKEQNYQVPKLKETITTKKKNFDPQPDPDCKICKVLSKPGDLPGILNQGLYHKYTSSQDYFYSRDVNAIITNKRKSSTILYNDYVILDTDEEHLKKFYHIKDSNSLMVEIKDFYTKFRDIPRHFEQPYYKILNNNIRKHRRLEYMKVFSNDKSAMEKVQNSEIRQKLDLKKRENEEVTSQFQLLNELGDSFIKDNYPEESRLALLDGKLIPSKKGSRVLDKSVAEIESNFKILTKLTENKHRLSPRLSDALYNKKFMLYSRQDSATAEQMLKDIITGFGQRGDSDSQLKSDGTATNDTRDLHNFSPTLHNKVQSKKQSPAGSQQIQLFSPSSRMDHGAGPLGSGGTVRGQRDDGYDKTPTAPPKDLKLNLQRSSSSRLKDEKHSLSPRKDVFQTPRTKNISTSQTPRTPSATSDAKSTKMKRANTPGMSTASSGSSITPNRHQHHYNTMTPSMSQKNIQGIYTTMTPKPTANGQVAYFSNAGSEPTKVGNKQLIKIKQRPNTTAKKRIDQDKIADEFQINRAMIEKQIHQQVEKQMNQQISKTPVLTNSQSAKSIKINFNGQRTSNSTALTNRNENESGSPMMSHHHQRQSTLTQVPSLNRLDLQSPPKEQSQKLRINAKVQHHQQQQQYQQQHQQQSQQPPLLSNKIQLIDIQNGRKSTSSPLKKSDRSPIVKVRHTKNQGSITDGKSLLQQYRKTEEGSPRSVAKDEFLDQYLYSEGNDPNTLKDFVTQIQTSNQPQLYQQVMSQNPKIVPTQKKQSNSVGKSITVQTPNGTIKVGGIQSSKSVKNLRATQTYFPNQVVAVESRTTPSQIKIQPNGNVLHVKAASSASRQQIPDDKSSNLIPSASTIRLQESQRIQNENSNGDVLKHILVSKQKIKVSGGSSGQGDSRASSVAKKVLRKSDSHSRINPNSSSLYNGSNHSGQKTNNNSHVMNGPAYQAQAKSTSGLIIIDQQSKTISNSTSAPKIRTTSGLPSRTQITPASTTATSGVGAGSLNQFDNYLVRKVPNPTHNRVRHINHPNPRLNENQLYFSGNNKVVTETQENTSFKNMSASYKSLHLKKYSQTPKVDSMQSPIKNKSPSRKKIYIN